MTDVDGKVHLLGVGQIRIEQLDHFEPRELARIGLDIVAPERDARVDDFDVGADRRRADETSGRHSEHADKAHSTRVTHHVPPPGTMPAIDPPAEMN